MNALECGWVEGFNYQTENVVYTRCMVVDTSFCGHIILWTHHFVDTSICGHFISSETKASSTPKHKVHTQKLMSTPEHMHAETNNAGVLFRQSFAASQLQVSTVGEGRSIQCANACVTKASYTDTITNPVAHQHCIWTRFKTEKTSQKTALHTRTHSQSPQARHSLPHLPSAKTCLDGNTRFATKVGPKKKVCGFPNEYQAHAEGEEEEQSTADPQTTQTAHTSGA